mmetsp:Transcript_7877/g.8353  ORF Transcript_7877/g.8353 Transcript_7877/m.8353 type:complete len:512 (-) Transcript_7877:190-1725(-)
MGGGISKERKEIKEVKFEIRQIRIGQVIGKGGFAIVYQAYHIKDKKVVAVKETNFSRVDSHKNELNMTLSELEALKHAGNHPFLVKLHYAFREGCCCYLVMDPLLGGDLRYHLRNFQLFKEHHVAYFVACIGSALHHLHVRGILHRDVKPENIGLDTLGRPYLTDFGISLISSIDNPIPISESSSGTLPYLSPEVLSPGNFHSHQSDYWSLGVLAYELFFGRRPFSRLCPLQMVQFVSNEYGWIWNELKKKLESDPQLTFHPGEYHNLHEDNNDENKNESKNLNKINLQKIGPMIDLESLVRDEIDTPIRFPDLNIYLNEDGTVPPCLMVPFPILIPLSSSISPESPVNQGISPVTPSKKNDYQSFYSVPSSSHFPFANPNSPVNYTTKVISEEFRNLLNGLLDVRIPYRLGNMSRYHEFNDHQCFIKHNFTFDSYENSPLLPILQSPRYHYYQNYSQWLLSSSNFAWCDETLESRSNHLFTSEVNSKLSEYKFAPTVQLSAVVPTEVSFV